MRRRHLVARWMPTFLGFPAGGLLAKLVIGRVDQLVPALAGGALSGAVLGLAQSVALRLEPTTRIRWIAATSVGFALGLGLGASAVGYRTDVASLATQGAICGALVGCTQALVLRPRLGNVAASWPVLASGLWALGWTITSAIGVDVEAQYTTFGSSGAVVVTAASMVVPFLVQRRDGGGAR